MKVTNLLTQSSSYRVHANDVYKDRCQNINTRLRVYLHRTRQRQNDGVPIV